MVVVLVQSWANSTFKTPLKTYEERYNGWILENFDFLLLNSECCKINPLFMKPGIWKYKDDSKNGCIPGCFLQPDGCKEHAYLTDIISIAREKEYIKE